MHKIAIGDSMNIKNLNLNDYKRNIAIILLAGLLLSLFGSFSYLIGMEMAVIKDVNGQTVQLDDEQRNALGACETLKTMIGDTQAREISFEGVAPFITNQNLQRVAQIIRDARNITQIAQFHLMKECIELFRCADYMKAPKKALSSLADRIYEPLRKKIKDTADTQEKAELEYFCEIVESNLSYYPDFSSLLKDKRKLGIERIEITGDVGISMSSGQKLGKKLKALDGIEALSDQAWTHKVKDLRIEGHELPKVNFAQIKQAFPAVNHVLLKGNELRHISNIDATNAAIDLRNNPIESITINNPRSLKNTMIFVDKNARPVVTFNQTRFDKCAQWFEALAAQSKVAIDSLSITAWKIVILGSSIVGMASSHLELFNAKRTLVEEAIDLSVGIKKLFWSPTWIVYPAINAALGAALLGGLNVFLERNQIRQDLAQLADRDGDHVNVCWTEPYHHGDTRIVTTHSCPSKYAYNLFGKN